MNFRKNNMQLTATTGRWCDVRQRTMWSSRTRRRKTEWLLLAVCKATPYPLHRTKSKSHEPPLANRHLATKNHETEDYADTCPNFAQKIEAHPVEQKYDNDAL